MRRANHGPRSYREATSSDWRNHRSDYHHSFRGGHQGPSQSLSQEYNQIVVFGDSLSDTGNLVRFLSGQPTQGQTLVPLPALPSPLSNGPLWIEQLAPKLGFRPEQVLNFAFAGATTGNSASVIPAFAGRFAPPGLLSQVDQYRSLTANHGGINPKALHVIFAGGNDFLTLPPNLLQGLATGNLQSFVGFARAIIQSVQNVATAVTNLALGGASAFSVINLPNLGRTPLLSQGAASIAGTLFTIGFNVLLETTMAQLERSLNINITTVDVFSAGEAVARQPQRFGITNLTTPLKTSGLPLDTPGFFYWDDFHPTRQVHGIIADTVERSLTGAPRRSQVFNTSLEVLQSVVEPIIASGAARPIAMSLLQQVQSILPTAIGRLDHLYPGLRPLLRSFSTT